MIRAGSARNWATIWATSYGTFPTDKLSEKKKAFYRSIER